MPDLLLELLTEEIPARMQARAAADLARLAREKFAAAGLAPADIESYVTPRRLVLAVVGLPATQPDLAEERKGPRVGSPEQAVQGFLKSAGLASVDRCEQRDTGKGIFYFAVIERAGRPTAELLPELLRGVIGALPWPKSMRFPAAGFRWVRPLASAICLFGGKTIPLDLDGVPVGNETSGHRFLAPEPFTVNDFADYRSKLRKAHVILDAAERRRTIGDALLAKAAAENLAVKDDSGLLDEVAGLVEWPVVLLGRIDAEFMNLPAEVLTTSMRTHQKYFACLDSAGLLAPRFLLVSNMAAADGGKAIIAGNERVLRARLSDARFFWDQDRKVSLSSRVPKLTERLFYQGLGTMEDKVTRLQALAVEIAQYVPDAQAETVRSAAFLAKADLSSGMVGEFPELQGVMGRYYALNDGEVPEVADAIAEHYSPLGPNDRCPSAPVSVAVALADKIDTLVGFFSIGETPTGSKDPYALRRAALGVIRLVLENRLRLPLAAAFRQAFLIGRGLWDTGSDPTAELLAFFADRLKIHLREQGVRHDLIAAVFALGGEEDMIRLLARVAALDGFLKSEDGANLLVAYRRASNIVRIEEKKDRAIYSADELDVTLLTESAETDLHAKLDEVSARSAEALGREDFELAMAVLAMLRPPVDEFFERVTVNTGDGDLRANRLRLLSKIRATLNQVAVFSEIEG